MKMSKAKHTGKLHIEKNRPNEDYVLAQKITPNIAVVVVADGAGSKRYGGATADCITRQVVKFCIENADRDDFIVLTKSEIYSYVNKSLFDMIKKNDARIEDHGATMMFAIVCDTKYVAGHVGDGAIFLKNGKSFDVLSLPENGEFINQTYFLPAVAQMEHFRMYEGELEKEFCFILTSDGISGTLYNPTDNQVSCACEQLYQWCKVYDADICDEILKENLEKVFDRYSDDDKSIAILCDGLDS